MMNIKTTLFGLLAMLSAFPVASAIPSEINYQGRLTDVAGNPASGSRHFSVKIYDAPTGGNELYSESIGAVNVDDNGIYSFQFGAAGASVVSITETVLTADGTSTSYTAPISKTPIDDSLSIADGTHDWTSIDGNPGAQALGTAEIYLGFVVAVNLTDGGAGYVSAPLISITGDGSGASATATVSGGVVTGVQITDAGAGYTTATVSIEEPPAPFIVHYSNQQLDVAYTTAPPAGTAITASYDFLDGSINEALTTGLEHWLELSIDGDPQSPRERILSVPFAQYAETATTADIALTADIATTVLDGAITSDKLASHSVTAGKLADGAVTADSIANNAVNGDSIAVGSITGDRLASATITKDKLDLTALDDAGKPLGRVFVGPRAVTSSKQYNLVMDVSESDFHGADAGAGLAIAAKDNKVYVLAGSTPDTVAQVYIYETSTASWHSGAAMMYPRTAAASCVLDDKIYVFGGEAVNAAGTYPSTVEVFDLQSESWETAGDMPEPRKGLAVEHQDGLIYVIGGQNDSGLTGRMDAFNPANNNWSSKASAPLPIARMGSVVFDGYVAIAGGESNSGILNSAYYYDSLIDNWSSLPAQASATIPRLRPQMIPLERYSGIRGVYIVGGIDEHQQRSNKVDYFRRGHSIYVLPLNNSNHPVYFGSKYNDDLHLWGDSMVEVVESGWSSVDQLPSLRPQYGDVAYWRNYLNCTEPLVVAGDYRLALLVNVVDGTPPSFEFANDAAFTYSEYERSDGLQLPYQGEIEQWYMLGLPSGLNYDASTGLITGISEDWGTHEVEVIGFSEFGVVSASFRLTVFEFVSLPEDNFAFISAGSFTMGDSLDGLSNAPQHTVNVSGFYMGKHELSWSLWQEVRSWAASNGYDIGSVGSGKGDAHPVHSVSWYDVVKWCNAASERAGLEPVYYLSGAVYRSGQSTSVAIDYSKQGYRLPTEAEWEKAARGGLSGKRFPWGDTIDHSHANYKANGSQYSYDVSSYTSYTYHPDYDSGSTPYTAPVGSFAANGYGLYDMSGNVREWCNDWYGDYSSSPETDPQGPSTGSNRVLRGGSWNFYAYNCRVAFRYNYSPDYRNYDRGFRLALSE